MTDTLASIRKDLIKIDKEIAGCLQHFRAAKNQEINPTAEMVATVKFPKEIEQLAINNNTPRELFSGVALFLALTTDDNGIIASRRMDRKKDRLSEFKNLCELLCRRHNKSSDVYEYKRNNPDNFQIRGNKIVTFIPDQHNKVVVRMHKESTTSESDGNLSANIISWVAAINAGWQDMAINENTGPFITPVTEGIHYNIQDPRPAPLAA
jgi:hypothetical protein